MDKRLIIFTDIGDTIISIAECINVNDIKLIHAMTDVFNIYCREHQLIASPDSRRIQ